MSDSSIEDTITIKEKFGHISNTESQKIADAIDKEIFSFFNKEVITETDLNVMPIERKGLNLFHPYLSNIEGLRNIISIKPLSYHQGPKSLRYQFFSVFNLNKGNILLTDAIATGSEIQRILQGSAFNLKALGGFNKVCGYLALRSALDNLEREFPNISFRFFKIVDTYEEYYEEHNKIIYVYQKRMEPIDEEHPFIILDVQPNIEFDELKIQIEKIITDRYGDDFELIDNDIGIDLKYNFTIYFNNPDDILYPFLKIQLLDDDVVEKLAIRFKFSSHDSKLRIMTLSMPNLACETNSERFKRIFQSICNREIPNRKCKRNFIFNLLDGDNRCLICAECVDKNISESLLNDVYLILSESGLMKVN